MKKNVLYFFVLVFISLVSLIVLNTQYFNRNLNQNNDSKNQNFFKISPTSTIFITPTLTHKQEISIIFAGDMMFDRHIREKAVSKGYDFILEDFKVLFNSADLVVANLEGPVTNFASKSVGSAVGSTNNYFFTFDPQILKTLKKYNIKIVNLGNNHINNFRSEGIKQTYQYLEKENINYFGDIGYFANIESNENNQNNDRFYLWKLESFTIAFVSFNQFVSNAMQHTIDDLQIVKQQADFIIVYPHWGNEYQLIAGAPISTWAHKFIDLGADLVIGAHPHVVQQKQEYKGKTIYYSLGNFVFDQYFSNEVRKGLLVKVTLDLDTKEYIIEEFVTQLDKSGKTLLLNE